VVRAVTRHRERLSLLSSGETPWLSVSQDGVEDDDELADAGGEGLFGGFSVSSELLIVRGDDRVRAACDQRGHVEGGPDRRPAPGDGLAAALDAAVAIDERNPDEGCDLAPVEAPEFRQLSDEGAQGGLAHARHAGQKVGVGLPGGAFSDRAVDVAIELGKFDLEKIDMPIDGRWRCSEVSSLAAFRPTSSRCWPRVKRSCLSQPIRASRSLRTGGSRSPGGDSAMRIATRVCVWLLWPSRRSICQRAPPKS